MLIKEWFVHGLNLFGKLVVIGVMGLILVMAIDAATHKSPVFKTTSVTETSIKNPVPHVAKKIATADSSARDRVIGESPEAKKILLKRDLCIMQSSQLQNDCNEFIDKDQENKLPVYLKMAFDHCLKVLGPNRFNECKDDVYGQ